MKTDTFIKLTNDILFKYVFSHKEVTFDLLNSFFDYIGIAKKIENLQVFKDYSIYGTNLEDKVFYSDVVAILEDTEYMSIEMYTSFTQEEFMKSASYLSRLFANQLKRGDLYTKAKKVYSINFITGNYKEENKDIVNDYGFVRKIETPNLDNEFIVMYLIRLDKVSKIVYNKGESRLIRWVRLMNSESLEEMKKIGKGDEVMEQAIAYVNQFLKEEGTTFQDKIEYEKAKSVAEGEAKGREEDKKETAKNLLDMNMSIKDICKATGLSEKDIHNIMKEC